MFGESKQKTINFTAAGQLWQLVGYQGPKKTTTTTIWQQNTRNREKLSIDHADDDDDDDGVVEKFKVSGGLPIPKNFFYYFFDFFFLIKNNNLSICWSFFLPFHYLITFVVVVVVASIQFVFFCLSPWKWSSVHFYFCWWQHPWHIQWELSSIISSSSWSSLLLLLLLFSETCLSVPNAHTHTQYVNNTRAPESEFSYDEKKMKMKISNKMLSFDIKRMMIYYIFFVLFLVSTFFSHFVCPQSTLLFIFWFWSITRKKMSSVA